MESTTTQDEDGPNGSDENRNQSQNGAAVGLDVVGITNRLSILSQRSVGESEYHGSNESEDDRSSHDEGDSDYERRRQVRCLRQVFGPSVARVVAEDEEAADAGDEVGVCDASVCGLQLRLSSPLVARLDAFCTCTR